LTGFARCDGKIDVVMESPVPSYEQVAALVTSQLEGCPRDVRELFELYRVAPVRISLAGAAAGEALFVLARFRNDVVCYDEVSGGFHGGAKCRRRSASPPTARL
jgi:hypothetical protein